MADIYAKTRAVANDTKVDLYGKQGATWQIQFTFPTGSLAGKSARGQIKKKYSDAAAIASWTCTIDGTDSIITALIKAAVTATITAGVSITDPKSEYVYDIEVYSGVGSEEVVSRSINGKLYIDPQATT